MKIFKDGMVVNTVGKGSVLKVDIIIIVVLISQVIISG